MNISPKAIAQSELQSASQPESQSERQSEGQPTPQSELNQSDIIYEFVEFTQKSNQTLTAALENTPIAAADKAMIAKLPLITKIDTERHFRLAYRADKSADKSVDIPAKQSSTLTKALQEIRVTRGNRMINFLVTEVQGARVAKSHPSQLPSQLPNQDEIDRRVAVQGGEQNTTTPSLANVEANSEERVEENVEASADKSPASSEKTLLRTAGQWKKLAFIQKKGEPLDVACNKANLSAQELQLIQSAPIIPDAKSDREFALIFEAQANQRQVRGISVKRGALRADFYRPSANQLLSLSSLEKTLQTQLKRAFDNAALLESSLQAASPAAPQQASESLASLGQPTVQRTQSAPSTTSAPSTNRDNAALPRTATQGDLLMLSFSQKPGQRILDAAKTISLSNLQRQLVAEIPVMKAAKSPRQFYLLFKRDGANQYLRAVRVVRDNRHAEFVLIKHTGKWFWANREGKISVDEKFLRYPLSYQRISSHFSMRRRHPVTKRIRPHLGTDFKAPTGTPVWSPASGVVTFAGRQSGYGKLIEIDHKNGYKTRYAHLSKILVKKGSTVKQRQTIGKVGNTGISTGPHLHYEVIVSGKHRNPLTVSLPGGAKEDSLAEARALARQYLPTLRQLARQ